MTWFTAVFTTTTALSVRADDAQKTAMKVIVKKVLIT